MEIRLADAGRRIDEIVSRVPEARDDIRVRVERRVHALRAREAAARSEAQAAAAAAVEAWGERSPSLRRELDEIDIDISIAQAQLDLDAADDRAAFEAAVRRQIDAYRALAEVLEERGGGESTVAPGDDLVESIRLRASAASDRLQRYRHLSNEVSDSLRAGVLVALDDLDRTATGERSTRMTESEGRARWG